MKLLGILLVTAVILPIINGSNIIFLLPFPGPSHWLFIKNFIKELLSRGHSVTAVTCFRMNEQISNYTEVLLEPLYDLHQFMPADKIFEQAYLNDFAYISTLQTIGSFSGQYGLEHKNVRKLIEREDLHFDLVIAEQFFQESWLMFAHKYKAPIITIGTYGYSDFFDRMMGLQTPWSHVPHMLLNYSDEMTFTQRFYNVILSMYDVIVRHTFYYPLQNSQAQKYFSNLEKYGPLPSVQELEKSISLILVNSHKSLSAPRPSMPGLIDIAGAHIKPPKPLPDDMKKHLDEAPDGVIYFSLGAFAKSADMPKEKVRILLDSFSTLKQRVLWKWEDENIPDLPPNVMVRKWMPQSDILAHKNVVLFITHGGLFGTTEGSYRGVPMLFMPLYGDQYRNALKAEAAGYALMTEFSKLQQESLTIKLNELINNKKYRNRAKKVSSLFRDNLVDPMEESIYWIEYVIRHKGAKHLKSAAVNQSIVTYMLMDVFGVLIAGFLAVAVIVYKILDTLIGKKETGEKTKSKKKQKKN